MNNRFFRNKIYKPKYEGNVQKPGTLERIIMKVFIVLDVLVLFFTILGIAMGELEMAIVFGILTLVFLIITFILKRGQDISYEETEEYFIARAGKKEEKVFYNEITGWAPSNNEIEVITQSKGNQKPVRVNLLIFEPEILLRQLADRAFAGKFDHWDLTEEEKYDQRIALIDYLIKYQYGYLVDDYIKQLVSEFE